MPPVRYTRRALARLSQIGEWIEEQNPEAAQRVVGKIIETIDLLSAHPDMGRPGRVGGTRELVVTGIPYIVAYRLKTSEIQIVTVLHASQRWPKRF
jgi:toxin ParE1/3/4